MGGEGYFKKVKQYEKAGSQHIIYRISGAGGFTYMDIELTRFKKQLGIADIFLFNTGENLSASVADLMKKLLSHEQSAVAQTLSARLTRISRHLKNTDYDLAKTEFDRLPYDIRNNRLYEMRYLEILSHLDEEVYKEYQGKIEAKYAADPGFQLMMIDVYLNQQKFDKALGSINQIDSVINKDPFLDYYRGLVLNMKGDSETAAIHFEKIILADPKFPDPYPELISLYCRQAAYPAAQKHFTFYKNLRGSDKSMVKYLQTNFPGLQ